MRTGKSFDEIQSLYFQTVFCFFLKNGVYITYAYRYFVLCNLLWAFNCGQFDNEGVQMLSIWPLDCSLLKNTFRTKRFTQDDLKNWVYIISIIQIWFTNTAVSCNRILQIISNWSISNGLSHSYISELVELFMPVRVLWVFIGF